MFLIKLNEYIQYEDLRGSTKITTYEPKYENNDKILQAFSQRIEDFGYKIINGTYEQETDLVFNYYITVQNSLK